jgi:NAD(P)-dependent dehydrogenase (short-subunit alcohol dehydrogenase family)
MFCREGAQVVFGDILDAEGNATEADLRAAGGEATYIHLNVTSEADWRRETAERLRRVTYLNNAGIHPQGIEETTEDDWDRIMAVTSRVFFGNETCHPGHATRWWWVHHQYLLDCRSVGSLAASAYRDQGRCAPLFTRPQRPTRQGQDSLQLGAPGPIAGYDQGQLENPRSGNSACNDCRCGVSGPQKMWPTVCCTWPR